MLKRESGTGTRSYQIIIIKDSICAILLNKVALKASLDLDQLHLSLAHNLALNQPLHLKLAVKSDGTSQLTRLPSILRRASFYVILENLSLVLSFTAKPWVSSVVGESDRYSFNSFSFSPSLPLSDCAHIAICMLHVTVFT